MGLCSEEAASPGAFSARVRPRTRAPTALSPPPHGRTQAKKGAKAAAEGAAAAEEPPKKKRRVGDPTATVVLQGVPPETTEAQLRAGVERFGQLRHLSLATDKLSGRRTGVAFAEYARQEQAAALVAAAAEKKVEVVGCRVRARALDAAPAAPRDTGKADKRNLYLAREGEVPLGSPAAVGVSVDDMAKRQQAAEEKAEKLKNPNYHVSSTRLFIRNMPGAVDEKRLRRLIAEAVEPRTGKAPEVVGAHVMRDAARVDKAGNAKSRGSAFVEFSNHPDALCALRALNNNPLVFTRERRPVVEFALEDVRQKYKRAGKLMMRKRAAAVAAEGGPPVEEQPAGEEKKPWAGKKDKKGKKGAAAGKKGKKDGKGKGKGGDEEASAPRAASSEKKKGGGGAGAAAKKKPQRGAGGGGAGKPPPRGGAGAGVKRR